MSRSFFDFFPVPRFLEMPAPGLSLTDSYLRLVEFKKDKEGNTLKQYGEVPLPPGTIHLGVIKDAAVLTKALEEFRKKYDVEYIRTMVSEDKAYLFTTNIAEVDGQDLRTRLEFTIEENVPLPVSELVFDYNILSKEKDANDEKKMEISVSAVPVVVVKEYMAIFKSAGFTPLHFEVESQAVCKSVIPRDDKRVFLVANIGKEKAGLYIVSNSAVAYSSNVPISLPDEITKTKTELKYISEDQDGKEIPKGIISGYAGLNPAVEEIKKILLYWQTKVSKEGRNLKNVEGIVICGDEGHREGLAEFFLEKTSISASVANVWINAFSFHDYVPDISLENSLGYAAAIGLGLLHRNQN